MKITIGAVVGGGTSRAYTTGSWRDQRPVVKTEACTACGRCESVCPDTAIHVVEEVYVVDYDYCKGCGLCAHECPVQAIVMVPEEK